MPAADLYKGSEDARRVTNAPQNQREKQRTPDTNDTTEREEEEEINATWSCIHACLDRIHSESLSMLSIPFNPLRRCTKQQLHHRHKN